jgi:hypothetical protein
MGIFIIKALWKKNSPIVAFVAIGFPISSAMGRRQLLVNVEIVSADPV